MKLKDIFKQELDPEKILQESLWQRIAGRLLGERIFLSMGRRHAFLAHAANHLRQTGCWDVTHAQEVRDAFYHKCTSRGTYLLDWAAQGRLHAAFGIGEINAILEEITGQPVTGKCPIDPHQYGLLTSDNYRRVLGR